MTMVEKGFLLLINLVLALGMFVFGMSAFFIGMFWLFEFLKAFSAWANTGTWPPLTLLQFMEQFSVPVPHTGMIGFQNIVDGWLAQSGIVWVFIIAMGCGAISNPNKFAKSIIDIATDEAAGDPNLASVFVKTTGIPR
jgi:hypothetical protein